MQASVTDSIFARMGLEPALAKRMPIRLMAAFLLGMALAASLLFAPPAQAASTEIDPQTQAALEQLEQAFADAYAQSQGLDAVAPDEASSLKSSDGISAAPGAETIEDDGTPLAAYQSTGDGVSGDEAAAVEEEILDDENPLAASPYASPVHDFVWVLLAVIVIAAAYFFFSTRRLDKNINQMRRFVD